MTLETRTIGMVPRQRADGEAGSVIGKVSPLATQGVAPNLSVQATQLISARFGDPRQWVITLMQATQKIALVNPWLSAFDGTAANPDDSLGVGRNFSAPQLPLDAGGNAGQLQVQVRWGAGGAAWETKFDYPLAGRVFGITAEHVDLFVNVRPGQATVYADAGLVPVVGAFMVEGIVTDPVPLRWQEKAANVNNAASVNYAVKPYARRVHITATSTAAGESFVITWIDGANQVVWLQSIKSGTSQFDVVLDIPAQAAAVNIENDSGNIRGIRVEWQIGLT